MKQTPPTQANRTKIQLCSVFCWFLCVLSTQAFALDSDGDGLDDKLEKKLGTEVYLTDTDGDGIPDNIEVGDKPETPLNTDGDKYINARDNDDDGDGLPTILENTKDTDNDDLANYLDPDSDNDGIDDGTEAGYLGADKNYDGIDDAFDTARKGAVDKNGDGIDDNITLPDHNQDGVPDHLDTNHPGKLAEQTQIKTPDTVTEPATKIKEQTETASTPIPQPAPELELPKKRPQPLVSKSSDLDNDGLSNTIEKNLGTDPNKRDSDGDKVSDAIEVGFDINKPLDSDEDGIIDALDNDDDNDGVLTHLEDLNKDSTAINDDTDGDGIPNYLDFDDDNDGTPTVRESTVLDSDGDGILDYLDKHNNAKDQVKPAQNVAKKIEQTPVTGEPEVVVLYDGNAENAEDKPATTEAEPSASNEKDKDKENKE